MRHPVYSLAWEIINRKWPSFALDPQNIIFGLATDGFNPFQDLSTSYNCWPVHIKITSLVMHVQGKFNVDFTNPQAKTDK